MDEDFNLAVYHLLLKLALLVVKLLPLEWGGNLCISFLGWLQNSNCYVSVSLWLTLQSRLFKPALSPKGAVCSPILLTACVCTLPFVGTAVCADMWWTASGTPLLHDFFSFFFLPDQPHGMFHHEVERQLYRQKWRLHNRLKWRGRTAFFFLSPVAAHLSA